MVVNQIKFGLRHLRLRRHGVQVEVNVPTATYGDGASGEWTICPLDLGPQSVVYSFGVGRNISWDLETVRRHGVQLHAFDPTPRAIRWIQAQQLPDRLHFHPLGIAAHDGEMRFFPPSSERSAHYSPIDRGYNHAPHQLVSAPVRRLATIMGDLNHQRLDILKLDIEGGEYDVLPDVLASGIPVGQILIEFHHNYKTVSIDQTLAAVAALRQRGYRIFFISRRGLEFSFIHAESGKGVRSS